MLVLNIIFIVIFSLYLYWVYGLMRALGSDAPFVPITPTVLTRILSMVQPKPGDVWMDLGSGDGRILIEAAKRYDIRGIGIERVAPLRQWSRFLIWQNGLKKKITIESGDFFQRDLFDVDIVTFYLLPDTNARLIKKLKQEMKPGSLGISHRFVIPGVPVVAHDEEHAIYVTRF